jgi:hypothetical protein
VARTPVTSEEFVRLPEPERREDGRGRHTDLTNVVANKILQALRLGAHQGPAAAWASIAPETMSRWMHRQGEPYETFQMKVREAEAYAEVRALGIVALSKDAKDAIAFLERRYPKRWARVPSVAVNQTMNVLDLGSLLDKIEKRRADPSLPRDPRPPRIIEAHAENVTAPEPAALPEARPRREPVL